MSILDYLGSVLGGAANGIGGLLGSGAQSAGLMSAPLNNPGTRDFGGFLTDYFRGIVPHVPTQQDYNQLLQPLLGTPQVNTNPIPITPSPIMRNGAELAQLGPDARNATAQQFGNAETALNARAAEPGTIYSGSPMVSPALASAVAPLLNSGSPLGGPMAMALLQARMAPNYQKLGPGESLYNVNAPGGGGLPTNPIASSPRLPDFGTPITVRGPNGLPQLMAFDKNGGPPKPYGGLSIPDITPVNGQLIDKNNPQNIGLTIPRQPEPALPQSVYNQQVNLAAAKAAGEADAKRTLPLLPANDPRVAALVPQVLNGTMQARNVPVDLRPSVAAAMNQVAPGQVPPSVAQSWTATSKAITDQYTSLPAYQLTANGSPYLARIEAARQHPGSVSDQDLLDSITKLNTSGNAISDEQVRVITEGKTLKDWFGIMENRIKQGGVLSPSQRQQISQLANATYANYQKQYQPVYEKAKAQLDDAMVPNQFRTIPDLNNLSRTGAALGAPGAANVPTATGPNGQKLYLRNGQWQPQ